MQRITISLLFILVCLTWGTTWLAIKIAVETITTIICDRHAFHGRLAAAYYYGLGDPCAITFFSRPTSFSMCRDGILFRYSVFADDLR